MKKRISYVLSIDEKIINIKGKTSEGIGIVGREECIVCHAISSIIINNEE